MEGGWAAEKQVEFWLYSMKENRIARMIAYILEPRGRIIYEYNA
jgi:hypothetical protein